ncbi:MAG: DUF3990 domain-containing protein [Spirochaetaceae bacterium]|jgi:hypothetical protein|nr:DUF3990 domain-containing protein [Spirochaetaceae bacterium]
MDSDSLLLYHGSVLSNLQPVFGKGNPHNDYGPAFYCTEDYELACEWACINLKGGFVNSYLLDTNGLSFLHLEKYTILQWLAVLVNNRSFSISSSIARDAKSYLLSNFLPDIGLYDIISGHRADDSYFSFSQDFLNNTISLRQLKNAMHFGNLGLQVVIKSQKAFAALQFRNSEAVDGSVYFQRRNARDIEARKQYLQGERSGLHLREDLFMLDIMREEIKNDDPRLQ